MNSNCVALWRAVRVHTIQGSHLIPNTEYAVNNIFLDGIRIAAMIPSGKARWFMTDQVDSVNVVTDDAGNAISAIDYLPYGETWYQEGDTGFSPKYNSQELDKESGLYFFNARHYDPEIARFETADSVVDGELSVVGWNRYSYVHNNPVKYKDPTGHGAQGDALFAAQQEAEKGSYAQDSRNMKPTIVRNETKDTIELNLQTKTYDQKKINNRKGAHTGCLFMAIAMAGSAATGGTETYSENELYDESRAKNYINESAGIQRGGGDAILKKFGVPNADITSKKYDPAYIKSELEAGRPVIARFVNDAETDHFETIVGYSQNKKTGELIFNVRDPGFQRDTNIDASTGKAFHMEDGARKYSKNYAGEDRGVVDLRSIIK